MRGIDFSSFQGAALTLLGLAVVTLIGVGVRLIMMTTFQQRRERMNRQINERLRTLIAAYKTLGGSFTGDLVVSPLHLRHLNPNQDEVGDSALQSTERSRRIRDSVEAALSDILLLGNEQQVRLAEKAAQDLVAGRSIHTRELVVSLRDFIREALDLDPLPPGLAIPPQGPARSVQTGGRGKGDQAKGDGAGEKSGGQMGMGIIGLGGGAVAGVGFADEDREKNGK